jgi:hypothetical protein
VITTNPIHPYVAGSASLYTTEHLRLSREHLTTAGAGRGSPEVGGAGSAERLDQPRCQLWLGKSADLGDLQSRRLLRHRQIGDGTVHELLVEAPASLGAVQVDPVRKRRRGLDVDACQRLQPCLPFALKGIDSDNGGEFINEMLLRLLDEIRAVQHHLAGLAAGEVVHALLEEIHKEPCNSVQSSEAPGARRGQGGIRQGLP